MRIDGVETDTRRSQSLERGLAILRCFSGTEPSLGVIDIAERLGMSRSTIHRYLLTLVALGYVEQDSRRKYRLGTHSADVGMAAVASSTLSRHARFHLEELRDLTSLTASVAVLDGTETLRLDSARRLHGRTIGSEPGAGAGLRRSPSHLTSPGKAILAHLGEDAQHELLRELTDAHAGSDTAVHETSLRLELAQAARRGYATNADSSTRSLYSIAAPVRDADGLAIAALELSTHGSSVSLRSLIQRASPVLIASADRLSSTLEADA